MNLKPLVPKSIPVALVRSNPTLWSVPTAAVKWSELNPAETYIISGSAFIDGADPFGPMGNPFVVVFGGRVKNLTARERLTLTEKTNAPEAVFINHYALVSSEESQRQYELHLSVYTSLGKELGACAHGFIGSIQTLVQLGHVQAPSKVTIRTTINTTAKASISLDGAISLQFIAEPSRSLAITAERLSDIYGTPFSDMKNLGVLSVGSPKLIVELSPETFASVQQNLGNMNYIALLELQQQEYINGIHLFCRNPESLLPEKCIQNNAYSGKDYLVDLATGVSNAAQVSADSHVKNGQTALITQYIARGSSAILSITKGTAGAVTVGGSAMICNYETI